MSKPEPRNLYYTLLLVTSLCFVLTALAWAIVPTLEEKARAAGEPVPESAFRDLLREHAGELLLVLVGGMIVFGLLSMWLDRQRRLQKEKETATISSSNPAKPAP